MADPNVKRGPAPPQTSLEESRAKSGVGHAGDPGFAKGARVFSRMPKGPTAEGRRAPPRPVRRSLLTTHELACQCALCQAGGKAGTKSYTAIPAATVKEWQDAAPPVDAPPGEDKLPKPEKKPKK